MLVFVSNIQNLVEKKFSYFMSIPRIHLEFRRTQKLKIDSVFHIFEIYTKAWFNISKFPFNNEIILELFAPFTTKSLIKVEHFVQEILY